VIAVRRRHAEAAPARTDTVLQELREKWSPVWWVWRSCNDAGEPNCWCATRRPEGDKPGRTLMEPTASELEKALQREPGGWPTDG
jgi:hypothetical protein